MEELLHQYNPWWEGAFDLPGVQPRQRQVDAILRRLSENRATLLTGLRRVGKTTLMRLVALRLMAQGVPARDILYVSLDDYLLRKHSIIDVVSAYRQIHKVSVDHSIVLLLDEIACKTECHLQLKNLIDRERATILASSSSASLLRDKQAALTGRSQALEIQPLSFREYLDFKNIHVATRDRQLLSAYFKDYMRDGGLPENVIQPSRDYLMTLVDDIIQKDITAFHGLKDQQILRDYFTLLMERSGKQASINKISNILKISPDTSRRYFGYFEETYLIHPVARWGKTNERILSPKKVYACDLGIKYLFIGDRDRGSYFENCVYLQIRPHQPVYYVSREGVEIDFFTSDETLIEVKFNDRLTGRQKELFDRFPAKRKIVIDSIPSLSQLEQLWPV